MSPTVTLREGNAPHDVPHVVDIVECTLKPFGDYGELIPQWMAQPEIRTLIAERDHTPLGICLFGTFRDPGQPQPYADVLAIAVQPGHHHQGIGREMLRYVLAFCCELRPRLSEVRLSVAETNLAARGLFQSEGFTPRPYELGVYRGGVLAMRLGRTLP